MKGTQRGGPARARNYSFTRPLDSERTWYSIVWSTSGFAADLARFLDQLGVEKVHVIGAKFGGSIALQFVADYPDRVRFLSVLSPAVRASDSYGGKLDFSGLADHIRRAGVEGWAGDTQRTRLGSEAPQELIDWWTRFMGSSDYDVCVGVTTAAGQLEMSEVLPRIQAPSLVITTDGSQLDPMNKVLEWQRLIPNSRLMVMTSDFYHVAAAMPRQCAKAVLSFIRKQ